MIFNTFKGYKSKKIILMLFTTLIVMQGAEKKISDLNSILNDSLSTSDILPIVDISVGETKKISISEIDNRYANEDETNTFTRKNTFSDSLLVDNILITTDSILSTAGNINIMPVYGSTILLDTTIIIDKENITGIDSITANSFIGDLEGTINTATTATTQTAKDSTTLVSTTAYVDAGIYAIDSIYGSLDVLGNANVNGASSFDGAVTINESSADVDFRVESDNDANALFVQGSDGFIGIGTNTPANLFDLEANIAGVAVSIDNQNVAGNCLRVNTSGNVSAGEYVADFRSGNISRLTVTTEGDVGINNSTPTALLHLAAGTTTNPPLKLTSGALLTSPEAGSIEYYDGKTYLTNVGTRKVIDRSDDVITSTTTVTNTTTETTIYTGIIGANSLRAGNILKLKCNGVISNDSASDDITFNIYIGSSLVLTYKPALGNVTDAHWHINGDMTIRTIGAGGTMAYHLDTDLDDNVTSEIGLDSIDTTVSEDFTVKVQWDNAKADNSISIYQGYTEFKN